MPSRILLEAKCDFSQIFPAYSPRRISSSHRASRSNAFKNVAGPGSWMDFSCLRLRRGVQLTSSLGPIWTRCLRRLPWLRGIRQMSFFCQKKKENWIDPKQLYTLVFSCFSIFDQFKPNSISLFFWDPLQLSTSSPPPHCLLLKASKAPKSSRPPLSISYLLRHSHCGSCNSHGSPPRSLRSQRLHFAFWVLVSRKWNLHVNWVNWLQT